MRLQMLNNVSKTVGLKNHTILDEMRSYLKCRIGLDNYYLRQRIQSKSREYK